MRLSLLLIFSLLLLSKAAYQQTPFNGDFEVIDPQTHAPSGMRFNSDPKQYYMQVDSMEKRSGKYSISITGMDDNPGPSSSGVMLFAIPARYRGREIELRGYLKTEKANYAIFWLRIDGLSVPALNNMRDQPIRGTQDWKEYSIKVPYDSDNAMVINAGALLSGNGKIWVDNLRLYIDGIPIDEAVAIPIPQEQQEAYLKKKSLIGWYLLGSNPRNYNIGEESSQERGGKVAFLSSTKSASGFGTIMQQFSAKEYLTKRVRLTGYIKSKDVADWAGMWFRIDGEWKGKPLVLGFDNMQSRPIKGTADWKKYEIVLNVPSNSKYIAYGVLLSGTGNLWIDDLNFEIVGKNVPVSKLGPKPNPAKPVNPGFESKD